MSKLNQVIAVLKTKKADALSKLNQAYHILQKPDVFMGKERTYTPKDDSGESLPSESKRVQFRVNELVNQFKDAWTNLFDVVITQDEGNSKAKANVVVNGKAILDNVPVTTLIFLEKQLVDFRTLIEKMPVLPDSDDWVYNNEQDIYVAREIEKARTQKIEQPIVLYEATDKFPAQTQLITKDVIVGTWREKNTSGAISYSKKRELLDRVSTLKDAIIKAREEANSLEIEDIKAGEKVFNFIFK